MAIVLNCSLDQQFSHHTWLQQHHCRPCLQRIVSCSQPTMRGNNHLKGHFAAKEDVALELWFRTCATINTINIKWCCLGGSIWSWSRCTTDWEMCTRKQKLMSRLLVKGSKTNVIYNKTKNMKIARTTHSRNAKPVPSTKDSSSWRSWRERQTWPQKHGEHRLLGVGIGAHTPEN